MIGALGNRLAMVADTAHSDDSARLLAALRIGAILALARVREVGGTYSTLADLDTVCNELIDQPTKADAAEAVPDVADESTRMHV